MLIGDAAACVSLLAGEGAGLAMTEAYVLAGELNALDMTTRRPIGATKSCCDRSLRADRSRSGTSPLPWCRRRGLGCGFATR